MITPSMLRAATLRAMTTKLVVNPFPSTLHRSFASTSIRYTSPKDTHDLTRQPSSHPAIQAVLNNPDIMDSLKHWVQVLQKNGVRLDEGKLPGPIEIMKILSIPEVREAAKVSMEKLKASGISIDAKTALDIFKSMKP